MSYYRVRVSQIHVIGRIWMPAIMCSQTIKLSTYDESNIGAPTRDNVEQWLAMHAGDFQCVEDFEADIGDAPLIPWAKEESECIFNDCMFAGEED
jgi:hypothetical protein